MSYSRQGKLPQPGKNVYQWGIHGLICPGYISTSVIAKNPHFHGIYYDESSHFYIDANTIDTDFLNTETGEFPILPYDDKY